MTVTARDAGIVFRLRLRLFSRLLLARYTPEAQRAAPYRLAAMLVLGGFLLWLLGGALGRLLTFAFTGQSLRAFLFPTFTWSATAATIGIFFYAVLSLVAAFATRSDLSLLLLTPVSPRLVLADRLCTVCMGLSAVIFVVGMPALIGAGGALHAGAGFILVALAVVLILPVPAAASAMLLAVLALHRLPAARARGANAVIATVAAALLYVVARTVGDVTAPLPWGKVNVVPAVWPGHALVAAADGHLVRALFYLVPFTLLALGLAALAVDRAAHLLASGWANYGEIGRSGSFGIVRPFPRPRVKVPARRAPDWWPVVRKEWLTLRRDPKLLAQLAYPLLIEGYSFYRAVGNPFTAQPVTGRLTSVLAVSLYLSASLTVLFLLSVLALPIVSREGRSIYLLALVPVRPAHLLLAKVLFCLIPVAGLLELLLVTIGARLLSMGALQTLYVGAVFLALAGALSCWLVCVGLIWPRLTADGARLGVRATALLVGPLGGGVLCTVVGVLLAASLNTGGPSSWAPTASGAAIFLLTGAIVAGVFRIGPRSLHNLLTGDRRPA